MTGISRPYLLFFDVRGFRVAFNESQYQSYLIQKLKSTFPGCVVLKNDSEYLQGIPDLIILYQNRWAMLEVKRSERARARPNQKYYIDLFDEMSFGAFIFPENEEAVFDDLQYAFRV